MKKALLFLLCMVLIISLVQAKIVIVNGGKDTCYEIPKTSIVPVIDGKQDACWYAVDWNMQRYYNVGDPPNATAAFGTSGATAADSGQGLTGMSKAMWDENNLYILFYTIDDVLIDIPANPNWNQDAVEIYIDGANNKTTETSLSSGQYQFTIPHWMKDQEAAHVYTVFIVIPDTSGIQFKISDVGDTLGFPGFMLEVKIPLAALGIDGTSADDKVIGWELQQDESDDATVGRQAMSKWWSSSNNSWANAGIWGKAILSSRTITDSVFEISKLPPGVTPPLIDGEMDKIYRDAHSITTNLFRVGDPPTAETVDTDPLFGGFITETPVYDETNFYIFLDVVDRIITDIPANPGWNQDAVELYFDGTNDHTIETSLRAGVQWHFTIPHWFIGTEAGRLAAATSASFDTTGVAFKITDRDVRGNDGVLTEEGSGYNVEVKIPLAALGLDGTINQPLGWELQLDNASDASVGRGGMEKWWNASNNSWANAGIWGYAKLTVPYVDLGVTGPLSVVRGYKLEQNYPNPFNPSTKITYELAKSEKAKLAVYNLLGEQVAELVNGMMSGTSHTVTFDAKNLASGIYFYKLEAGSTTLSKKMILIK